MFRSDALERNYLDIPLQINVITPEVVARIEVELDSCDLVSMVFLLYDVPDTALQSLIVYQRVSRDDSNMNLLSSWARSEQASDRPWREKFLESLAICQLYKVVRKLGFRVSQVKEFYQPNSLDHHVHVNPIKKALYRLCENITSEELVKLKKALKTYKHDTTECLSSELVILKLMSNKFITVPRGSGSIGKVDIDHLLKIIQKFTTLQHLAVKLKDIQSMLNRDPNTSTPTTSNNIKSFNNDFSNAIDDEKLNEEDVSTAFDEVYKLLSEMNLDENATVKNLKSDKKSGKSLGAYNIKDPNNVGVCCIINQVEFYPSKASIDKNQAPNPLETRKGSNKDCRHLQKTFEDLNFEVIAYRNVDHEKMKDIIANIVEYRVQHSDSMFVLCILSHGVKGHVYAADSVQVKVEDIQNWLDSSFQQCKLEIPKIMILQACQVNNECETQGSRLVADSSPSRYLRKAHFLVYWATAPELEAYRDEQKGSIFILLLCYYLDKLAKTEDVYSIFTRVTKAVAKLGAQCGKDQTPIFESTLMEKLYLQDSE